MLTSSNLTNFEGLFYLPECMSDEAVAQVTEMHPMWNLNS